jgi:3-dehydroquinate dehydratase
MGPKGRLVRAVAPLLGSPFTYAAPNRGKATAPGQPRARELANAIAALRRAAGVGR